jgi:hypothetical protein
MAVKIYSTPYYYTTARDVPGEACRLLTRLAGEDVNLIAFNALPIGTAETQLIIYPLNTTWLADTARRTGLTLQGPRHAFLVQGDDELGSLVEIHRKLFDADINVETSSGLADGKGGYRYLLHVHEDDFERACEVLGATHVPSRWDNFELKIPRHFEARA